MSDFKDNFDSWQDQKEEEIPFDPESIEPQEPEETFNRAVKMLFAFIAELVNWLAHVASLMLANPIGNDKFISDIIQIEIPLISDISLGAIFCALIGLVAVAVPYVAAFQIFSKPMILREPGTFFKERINKVGAVFLFLMYLLVLLSEGASLMMRVHEEMEASVGPFTGNAEPVGMTSLAIYSVTLIAANLCVGVAAAWVMSSIKKTKGGQHVNAI